VYVREDRRSRASAAPSTSPCSPCSGCRDSSPRMPASRSPNAASVALHEPWGSAGSRPTQPWASSWAPGTTWLVAIQAARSARIRRPHSRRRGAAAGGMGSGPPRGAALSSLSGSAWRDAGAGGRLGRSARRPAGKNRDAERRCAPVNRPCGRWPPAGPWAVLHVVLDLLALGQAAKPSDCMAVWWTNTSLPPASGVMNPKPFASLNHFTVPLGILHSPAPNGAGRLLCDLCAPPQRPVALAFEVSLRTPGGSDPPLRILPRLRARASRSARSTAERSAGFTRNASYPAASARSRSPGCP